MTGETVGAPEVRRWCSRCKGTGSEPLEATAARAEAPRLTVEALAEALHADPSLCAKHSPHGHPRWMLRPLCVSVAERLFAALAPDAPLEG